MVVAGGLGYFCYLCGKVFPWNIDNALTAIPFLYVGVLIRKYWREMSKLRYLLVYMVVTAMVFCFGILGGDFDGNSIGGIYFTGLEAIIVSTCIMSLIYQISLTRIGGGDFLQITKYFGKNTLILFGYNYAINAFLHFLIPTINHSWVMAITVITIGAGMVYIANKFKTIKNIIV